MNGFFWNINLALVWVAISGQFTASNFALGLGLGFLILFFTRRIVGLPTYGTRAVKIIGLLLFFLWELLKANLRVAYEVLTPGYQLRPGIVAVPLDVKSDIEITLLAGLVALTPGSISLDVSQDRSVLYVHFMYVDDPEALRREVKEGFERRIMEVFQ